MSAHTVTPTAARTRRPRARLLLLLVAGALALSGCGFNFSVYSLPLPGGANLGSNPITIKAQFDNVLDLVPKSSVKVDDISVGEITDVSLDKSNDEAIVTMKLRDDTHLPANTVATIRQTSLLGEKFVSLAPPTSTPSEGTLENGAFLKAGNGADVQIEDVFGALSLLLNNGGIAQLHTIASEINQTLSGREDDTRDLLTQIKTFTGQLDTHRDDIVAAITRLDQLSVTARGQQRSIDNALDQLPSALNSLNGQRADLVKMLKALDNLSTVGVRVIKRSKTSTIETVRQLQPVLTELADSGSAFVKSFSVALTYPFVDQTVGRDPTVARNLQLGDYVDLDVDLQLNYKTLSQSLPGLPCTTLSAIPSNLPLNQILSLPNLCSGVNAAIQKCAQHPTSSNCAGIPAGVLTSICNSLAAPAAAICKALPTSTEGKGTKGRGGSGGSGLPGVPGLPGLPGVGGLGGLGHVLHSIGLGRAPSPVGSSPAPRVTRHRVTLAQLAHDYDPALVSLLTPGMVTQ